MKTNQHGAYRDSHSSDYLSLITVIQTYRTICLAQAGCLMVGDPLRELLPLTAEPWVLRFLSPFLFFPPELPLPFSSSSISFLIISSAAACRSQPIRSDSKPYAHTRAHAQRPQARTHSPARSLADGTQKQSMKPTLKCAFSSSLCNSFRKPLSCALWLSLRSLRKASSLLSGAQSYTLFVALRQRPPDCSCTCTGAHSCTQT